jgi:nuclear pore complex protein Nup188
MALRKAVWNFVSLAVDKEPALARLLVARKSGTPLELEDKKEGASSGDGGRRQGKENEQKEEKAEVDLLGYKNNALDAACDILVNWKAIWEANPLILSCVLRFLDVVWQHALEHKTTLEPLRKNGEFWERIVAIACHEVGPVPEYTPTEIIMVDGIRRSSLHDSIQGHSYRSLAKSYALHVVTRDIGLYLHLHRSEVPLKKPESYLKLEPYLKSQDQLTDLLAEAAPSSYAPSFHDDMVVLLQEHFQGLTLSQLEQQDPISDRDYGENFAFSIGLLRLRLQAYTIPTDLMNDPVENAEKLMITINLNLSLAHSELNLIEAWNALLRQVIPYMRMDTTLRPHILAIAASISYDIASEKRSGEMMSKLHGARLSLVLVLLEVVWFSSKDTKAEVESFMELTRNLRGIVLNEGQSPARSLLSSSSNPFHRTLLQIIFYFAKQAGSLINRPKTLNAEQRLTIASTVEAVLTFVIDALRVVFITARSRSDVDLDRDMELLVAVFEQCTRPDLVTTTSFWLARCQEMDVIQASLDLYVHLDLAGSSDLPLLLSRKQPLYSPHVLLFHMALASSPIAAERLASEGILTAYSKTRISPIISSGRLDTVLSELPGHRNPAHLAYCSMLSIVAMVITALGRQNHYFDSEACGFVQLYGDQISRALSWTIGDPISLPLLEEIDQVVNLFYAIAASVSFAAKSDPAVAKVLRVFTTHALQLLQQVNYAITHPNHLVSLYEPVTHDERVNYEKTQSQTDLMKRPIVMHLIHRFFKLSSNILGTLIVVSRADAVLSSGVEDWPLQEALVIPVRFQSYFEKAKLNDFCL